TCLHSWKRGGTPRIGHPILQGASSLTQSCPSIDPANMASSNLRANIEATTRQCVDSYEAGASAQDPSLISRSLAPECTRKIVPMSFLKALGAPTDMAFTNELYEQYFAGDIKVSAIIRSEVTNLTIDVEERK